MIIFSLFGTTTGLELINLPLTEAAGSIRIDDEWVEISESHAKLNRERDVIVVERRSVGSNVLTWVGLYRHVREIGYDRNGTFYGAGCWLVNSVADSKGMIESLRHLADQVKQYCINGDKFEKRIADAVGSIKLPEGAMALLQRVEKLVDGCSPSGDVAFIGAGQNILEVVDWAQRAQSSVAYSRVIVGGTDSAPSGPRRSGFHVFASLVYAIEYSFHCGLNERKLLRSEVQEKKDLQEKIAALQEREAVLTNDIAHYQQRVIGLIREKESLNNLIKIQSQSLQQNINGGTIRTSSLPNDYSGVQETFAIEGAQYINQISSGHAAVSSSRVGVSQNSTQTSKEEEGSLLYSNSNVIDPLKGLERPQESSEKLVFLIKTLGAILGVFIISVVIGYGIWSPSPGCQIYSFRCTPQILPDVIKQPKHPEDTGSGPPHANGGSGRSDPGDSPGVTPPPPAQTATSAIHDGSASGPKPKTEKPVSGKSTPPQGNGGQR